MSKVQWLHLLFWVVVAVAGIIIGSYGRWWMLVATFGSIAFLIWWALRKNSTY